MKAYYKHDKVTIYHADVLEWTKGYKGEKFHAVLSDPPYELGFMGKNWDKSGIAFKSDTWDLLTQHLHPGAFGMAFASARGWHRLAVAIEDAGLRIHPSIFCWNFATGFPKATRIKPTSQDEPGRNVFPGRDSLGVLQKADKSIFEGHRYGLQAMKPAIEPLITFTKPLRVNPFCVIMTEITFLMEVLSCMLLNVQDAESLTSHLHQRLRADVDNSAQKNVDDLALLKTVTIAGNSSGSSLAGSTLADFVAGPVPTPDAMLQLVNAFGIGEAEALSTRDTDTYEQIMDILQNIAWLWSECLDALLTVVSTFITEMETVLTTDLRILKLCLRQTISGAIIHQNEPAGKMSLVHSVESLLKSLVVKLPLLTSTIVTGSVIDQPARQESDQGENKEDGASLRPIIVFQKPYNGKPVESIVETGAGALNIAGGRIGTSKNVPASTSKTAGSVLSGSVDGSLRNESGSESGHNPNVGRWPANFCLTHHPECVRVGERKVTGTGTAIRKRGAGGGSLCAHLAPSKNAGYADPDGLETVPAWECVEDCPARRLGEQSGESVSRGGRIGNAGGGAVLNVPTGKYTKGNPGKNDKGTAARYFHNSDWSYEMAERLERADPVFYCAKASRKERNDGLSGEEQKAVIFTTGKAGRCPIHNKTNPSGLNTYACGCKIEYNKEQKTIKKNRNYHPTVKPIKLTQWLATLLLPPPEYAPRRILIPFSGSGSEAIGALLAGWDEVVLIDNEREYCDIAAARLEYWTEKFNEPRQLGLLGE